MKRVTRDILCDYNIMEKRRSLEWEVFCKYRTSLKNALDREGKNFLYNLLPLAITYRVVDYHLAYEIMLAASPSEEILDLVSRHTLCDHYEPFENVLRILASAKADIKESRELAVEELKALGFEAPFELDIIIPGQKVLGPLRSTSLEDLFKDYYAHLSDILKFDVENLLPQLIKEGVVASNDKATKTISSVEKTQRLMMIISGSIYAGYQKSFVNLLKIMKRDGNEASRDLASKILKLSVESGELRNDSGYPERVTFSISVLEIFTNYFDFLCNVLGCDVENLMPQCIEQKLLTIDDKTAIENTTSLIQKSSTLLTIVARPQLRPHAFINCARLDHLLKIMANDGNAATQDLASQIMKEINDAKSTGC